MTLPYGYLNHVETLKQMEKRVTALEKKFAALKEEARAFAANPFSVEGHAPECKCSACRPPY